MTWARFPDGTRRKLSRIEVISVACGNDREGRLHTNCDAEPQRCPKARRYRQALGPEQAIKVMEVLGIEREQAVRR